MSVLKEIKRDWLVAFVDHEDEYIEFAIKWVKLGSFKGVKALPLPAHITIEQLKPLIDFLDSVEFFSKGYFCFDEQMKNKLPLLVELEDAVKKKYIEIGEDGFDFKPFNEEWTWAGDLVLKSHRIMDTWGCITELPLALADAISQMYLFGNRRALENSLALAILFIDQSELQESLLTHLEWFVFSPRVKEIFAMLKPYLTSFDGTIPVKISTWKLLPLYQEMIDNPDDYWLDSIKEGAMAWAKRAVNESRATIIQCPVEEKSFGILNMLAMDRYFGAEAKPAFASRLISNGWRARPFLTRDNGATTVDLWLKSGPKIRAVEVSFLAELLQNIHVSMVMSANLAFLHQLLRIFTPPGIGFSLPE